MSADTAIAAEPPPVGQGASFTYDAFLSYDRQDGAVAAGIQGGLHRIGRRVGRLNALRVFRDSTDLAANPELWGKVTDAMDHSRYLIVVLSPRAAASEWVNKEVAHWLERRGPKQLLIVVADGYLHWEKAAGRLDPDHSDIALPVLSKPGVLPREPLFIDVRMDAPWDPQGHAFRDKLTALAAVIHGKSQYELASDDLREQRRFRRLRRFAIVGLILLTVIAVAAAMIAIEQRQELLRLSQQASDRPQPSVRPQPFFVSGSAIFGAFVGAAVVGFAAYANRVARRGRHGLLVIAEATAALTACNPTRFTTSELHNRRKFIHEIDRVAATIEGIPAALKVRDPTVIRAAMERGAAIRALQIRIASLSRDGQQAIIAELRNIKEAYDSGRWLDLPAVDVEIGLRSTLASRIIWTVVAVVTFAGIVAMVVLSAMGLVPPGIGAPVPFVLGVILYAALARLGVSGEAMKNAVDVTSKVSGGLPRPGKDV